MDNDRRELLKRLVASAAAGAMPASINKALAIPAHNATGTIADVEHIVILMQENRAFDHYLGTLSGVRGFSDPRAATLTTGATAGQSVFYQPGTAQTPTQGYTLPFHPPPDAPAPTLGLTFLENLAHDWQTTHQAWNYGQYDSWIQYKTPVSMAYLTRTDIPFHYALADAFTVCDGYHASQLGSTHPNRLYMWTGWVGNDGKGGGPAVANNGIRYTYETFPEKLTQAGVSWKIYQDVGNGPTREESFGYTLDALIGNFGDNALLYFKNFQGASPNSTLYRSACTGTRVTSGKQTLFDILEADVQAGKLPQVSWVVSPEAYSEHPNWPPNYGAYYISKVLDALTSNPSVWSKTAFIITYDEKTASSTT